ncbi:MAG: hypothetical protein VX642_05260 [Bdellovibrionota bacterium]|nr:hypothetical protein [Bdellovibrionota bacterium]
MKPMKAIFLLISLFLLCNCSSESSSSNYCDSYQYKENGCDTGKMVFEGSSAEEVNQLLCSALQDDELNRYCAYDMRLARYKQSCM